MNRHFVGLGVGCLLLVWVSLFAAAQQPITGIPPLSSTAGGPFDTVNLANLDVHFSIPVFSRAGKGIPFFYNLTYDSLIWAPVSSGGLVTWKPATNWGWAPQTSAATGYMVIPQQMIICTNGGRGTEHIYGPFTYIDPSGTSHFYNDYLYHVSSNGTCPDQELDSFIDKAQDGSGLRLSAQLTGGFSCCISTVTTKSGVVFSGLQAGGNGLVTDPNGNTITITATGVFTDTLNSTALTVTGAAPNPVQYQYTAPSTGAAAVTVTYHSYTVTTQFGVQNIGEYSAGGQSLVDRVTLPDGSYYQFYYEATGTGQPYTGSGAGPVTARIAEVILPTDGTITYTYGSTNSMMADGSPSYLARTLGGGTWNYWRSVQQGQQTTTQFLDPGQNETDINFSGVYQTSAAVYQGNTIWGSSRTLLKSTRTCYNDNFTNNCQTSVATPITDRYFYDNLTNQGIYSIIVDGYDSYGNVVWDHDYNYNSSPTIFRSVVINYNGPLCSSANICDHPSSTQVKDGSGASKSYTTYTYDEGGYTHGSVTTVSRSSTGLTGGPFLTQHYSYNSNGTGTLVSASDPNGTVTTYSPTSCNNAFPTSVTVSGLITSYAYNCTGGVVTSVTDPNNRTSSTNYTYPYSDPYFWRPASSTDQSGYVTYYNYYGRNNSGGSVVSQVGQVESVLNVNGGTSVVDVLSTVDGYGRHFLQQTREGPGSQYWDSVEKLYYNTGRVMWDIWPYRSSTAGQGSGGGLPATGYTYDALGRYTDVGDWTGVDTHYAYYQNDVTVTVNPAPSGENAKTRQYESDALGRLTSVCEVTGATTAGCGQNNGTGTGYQTTYVYDPLGNLTNVTEAANVTPQTRTFFYDGLSRMTKEINPESGTFTYTYDSDPCSNGHAGDLVKKVDNAGNTTCYYHDSIHRVTDVGSPSGCLRYRYDSATVNNSQMANAEGRLAETMTDNCGGTQYTVEGFSYSARGEMTDVYESTTHSGGYYHVQAGYWENGLLKGLNTNVSGVPSLNYYGDGEGRPYSVTAGSGQNPLSSTVYDAANHVTGVSYGSGDSDAFVYSSSSGRMTQATYNVASQAVVHNLTWNANGTLSGLAITDPLNANNTQTCGYTHDDLTRISAVSCGTTWGQTFNYDAFGNLKKNGSSSWLPTYDSSNNNRYQSGGGISYDGNGKLLGDTFNTYTWSAYGNPASVNGQALVFDALGRMVENSTSGREYIYAPGGSQVLAVMNGQTPVQTMFPLAGGATAVYDASAHLSYAHADWLGSGRLVTSSTRTMLSDSAYGPFGEQYAATGSGYIFTGQQQWTAMGLDDFLFRRYSPVQGRWVSPDPAGLAAVDITNPQSWNRYAYVNNNPLRYIDPLGLCGGTWTTGSTNENGDLVVTSDMPCPLLPLDPTSGMEGFFLSTYGPGGGGGGGTGGGGQPQPPAEPAQSSSNGPTVPKNPCQYQGRALPPSAYAQAGQAANAINFALDVHYGWGSGQYMDAQPLTNAPGTWNAAAYGNYVYGVYMQAAGAPLSVALRGAEGYALTKTYPTGTPMQPWYPGLPAANAQNITNGYNAQANGTTCQAPTPAPPTPGG